MHVSQKQNHSRRTDHRALLMHRRTRPFPSQHSPFASLLALTRQASSSSSPAQECVLAHDEEAAPATSVSEETLSVLERCILDAKSEDDVQGCMLRYDEEEAQKNVLPLGECLEIAGSDKKEIDECVLATEESDEHAYG